MTDSTDKRDAAGKRRRTRIVLGLLVLGAAAVFWHKVVREHVFPKNFGVVEEGKIYRSGQLTPRMFTKVVNDHGIKTVIALNGDGPDSEWESRDAEALGATRMEYLLPGDGTGPPETYAEVLKIVGDPARQPVLVHCAAGAQRTSTVVVLYRHFFQAMPIAEAYPESFDYKHEPDEWVLLAYLADHLDEITNALEEDRAPQPRP